MSKKKVLEIVPEPIVDSRHDKKYRPSLKKHLALVEKWSDVSAKAAAGYPEQVTAEQQELYNQAVRLAEECREVYDQIIAMNLYPAPQHPLIPVLDLS
jgi:hypothetical protein